MQEFDHEYMHAHGIEHDHAGGHTHEHSHGPHSHTHPPEETKAIANRLARAIGHLEHVKMMVEEGRDCTEVLVQLSAVKSALNSTGILLLQSHIEHCIVDAVKTGDMEAVADLNKAISRYIK